MMKYTLEQRMEIGRLIYAKKIIVAEAADKYVLNNYTARDYMRYYRGKNQ